MNKKEPRCEGRDVVQLGPEVAPGVRMATRHHSDHSVENGYFSEAKDGKPIPPGAELVNIGPSNKTGWRPGESIYGGRENPDTRRAASDGPAQVATPAYRDGYDRIFGKKATVGQA